MNVIKNYIFFYKDKIRRFILTYSNLLGFIVALEGLFCGMYSTKLMVFLFLIGSWLFVDKSIESTKNRKYNVLSINQNHYMFSTYYSPKDIGVKYKDITQKKKDAVKRAYRKDLRKIKRDYIDRGISIKTITHASMAAIMISELSGEKITKEQIVENKQNEFIIGCCKITLKQGKKHINDVLFNTEILPKPNQLNKMMEEKQFYEIEFESLNKKASKLVTQH